MTHLQCKLLVYLKIANQRGQLNRRKIVPIDHDRYLDELIATLVVL